MEFLEPKARSFNNIPQSKNETKRINCPVNDGSFKAHFLTSQQSKNKFEWRIKRPSLKGNCTIRATVDGIDYMPLTPLGQKNPKFACGRAAGYETATYKLPK